MSMEDLKEIRVGESMIRFDVPVLGPAAREEFILKHFEDMRDLYKMDVSINRYDKDFVDEYVTATGASFKPVMYGAWKCNTLAGDLKRMSDKRILRRSRVGLEGGRGLGFPAWTWDYRLR